ncbi:MAG: Asp-tRNA(Asn)/Glu-tRNA(Gln) amidotransferase subunit GatA [Planctomycetota bacterium]
MCDQTAAELLRRLEAGEVTCVDVMDATLGRIEAREAEVGAFLSRGEPDAMRAAAASVDARRRGGEPVGALGGLPVGVKDNLCVEGTATTCGSRLLGPFVPPYTATAVQRVLDADGIVIGKTNLDEFAMGSSTENSALGQTRNPRDASRVAGGSSGGSAAAVAAGMVPLALGSDTGGSIRQPASFCGVVGLKPTYGRVSRYGLVAYASSLDQVGPITRSVDDAALLLNVIAGHDPRDSTSLDCHVPDYLSEDEAGDVETLRIGVPGEYDRPGGDPAVGEALRRTLDALADAGHIVEEVSLPHSEYAVATYYLLASAEASSNLARYDGTLYGRRAEDPASLDDMIERTRGEGFGDEVKRRIMLGTYALSTGYAAGYYEKALRVRRLIQNDFVAAFEKFDVLMHPVAPHPAFRLGEKTDDPLSMYLEDVYSVPANLAGLPAISVPAAVPGGALPVGVQVVAPALAEVRLLAAARRVEAVAAAASVGG